MDVQTYVGVLIFSLIVYVLMLIGLAMDENYTITPRRLVRNTAVVFVWPLALALLVAYLAVLALKALWTNRWPEPYTAPAASTAVAPAHRPDAMDRGLSRVEPHDD